MTLNDQWQSFRVISHETEAFGANCAKFAEARHILPATKWSVWQCSLFINKQMTTQMLYNGRNKAQTLITENKKETTGTTHAL